MPAEASRRQEPHKGRQGRHTARYGALQAARSAAPGLFQDAHPVAVAQLRHQGLVIAVIAHRPPQTGEPGRNRPIASGTVAPVEIRTEPDPVFPQPVDQVIEMAQHHV